MFEEIEFQPPDNGVLFQHSSPHVVLYDEDGRLLVDIEMEIH